MRVALLGAFPVHQYRHQVRFWHSRPGSSPTWNLNLAAALGHLPGVEVHVFTHAPRLTTRTVLDDNVHVHLVGHLPKVNLWQQLTQLQYGRYHLRNLLRKLGPDLVHGSGTDHEYGYAAVMSGFPNIVTIHGVMRQVVARGSYGLLSFESLLARYERRVLKRSRFLIAINDYVIRQFPEFTGTTFRIPNAVGPQFFRDTDSDGPEVLFVGRIEAAKRPMNLVRAIEQLVPDFPRVQAVFVGAPTGRHAAQINAYVARAGLEKHVHLVGLRSQVEISDMMARAAMLVLPSMQETSPMVIAEAQVLGKPVVATNVGGIPEMIEHGSTGLLVEPDDVPALASAIQSLLDDPDARGRMGCRAREISRPRYHPDVVARQTLEAYRAVLDA